MDYVNFENGYTRELAGRCVGQVDPQNFFSSTLLDFIKNIIQFAGYTYIIALLHPIVIMMIIAIALGGDNGVICFCIIYLIFVAQHVGFTGIYEASLQSIRITC